eukprot:COSAG06_NODE_353_length_16899_cov_14.694345_17_plen_91_part_00
MREYIAKRLQSQRLADGLVELARLVRHQHRPLDRRNLRLCEVTRIGTRRDVLWSQRENDGQDRTEGTYICRTIGVLKSQFQPTVKERVFW